MGNELNVLVVIMMAMKYINRTKIMMEFINGNNTEIVDRKSKYNVNDIFGYQTNAQLHVNDINGIIQIMIINMNINSIMIVVPIPDYDMNVHDVMNDDIMEKKNI